MGGMDGESGPSAVRRGHTTSVVDDGSTGAPVSLSGYSIVEAADLESAAALADGHPYLSEGSGDYAIEIFEMMPVPFQE